MLKPPDAPRLGRACCLFIVWSCQGCAALAQTSSEVVTVNGQRSPTTAPSQTWDAGTDPTALPISFSVQTKATLDALGASRVEDLAGLVPGLQADVSNAGLSSAVRMRGFQVTRLYFNGLPDIQRLFSRDLATVERVEVLSGPSGVFHGVTSPGGVVQYIGKEPLLRTTHVTRWAVDQHGVGKAEVDLTGPILDAPHSVAYRLVAAATDGDAPPASLPQRRHVLLAATSWAYQPGARLLVEAERQRNRTPFNFGTVIIGGGKAPVQVQYDRLYVLPGGAPATRDANRWAIDWQHPLAGSWTMSARHGSMKGQRRETLVGFFGLESDRELSGYYTRYEDKSSQRSRQLRAEGDWESIGMSHHIAVGLERHSQQFRFAGVQNIAGFSLDVDQPDFSAVDVSSLRTTPRFSQETQTENAWWISDRVALGRETHLTGGLRRLAYRIEADRTGAGLQAAADQGGDAHHLGLSIRAMPHLQTYVAIGTGLEPNRGTQRDGTYLPPQRQRQVEVGARWTVAESVSLQGAAYRIRLSDLPVTDPLDRTAFISAGQRTVQGMQGTLRAVADRWDVDAHVHLLAMRQPQPARAGQGASVPGVARRTAGLRASRESGAAHSVWTMRWTMSADAVGPRFADATNATRLQGYALIHSSAEWRLSQWTIASVGVRNLFDRRYVEAVTAVDDVYQGPRRRLWMRLTTYL